MMLVMNVNKIVQILMKKKTRGVVDDHAEQANEN